MEGFTSVALHIKENWDKNLQEKHRNSLNEDTDPSQWPRWPSCLECNYQFTLIKSIRSERPSALEARWKRMIRLSRIHSNLFVANLISSPISFAQLRKDNGSRNGRPMGNTTYTIPWICLAIGSSSLAFQKFVYFPLSGKQIYFPFQSIWLGN